MDEDLKLELIKLSKSFGTLIKEVTETVRLVRKKIEEIPVPKQ